MFTAPLNVGDSHCTILTPTLHFRTLTLSPRYVDTHTHTHTCIHTHRYIDTHTSLSLSLSLSLSHLLHVNKSGRLICIQHKRSPSLPRIHINNERGMMSGAFSPGSKATLNTHLSLLSSLCASSSPGAHNNNLANNTSFPSFCPTFSLSLSLSLSLPICFSYSLYPPIYLFQRSAKLRGKCAVGENSP